MNSIEYSSLYRSNEVLGAVGSLVIFGYDQCEFDQELLELVKMDIDKDSILEKQNP